MKLKSFRLQGCCDVLKPYMEMSVALQGLSVPCWKVVVWWRKVKDYVEEVEKEFSQPTTTKRLPLLDKHLTNIKAGLYKGTPLWGVPLPKGVSSHQVGWLRPQKGVLSTMKSKPLTTGG